MADKIEKEFNKNELADYLEGLAVQLRAGKLASGNNTWTVPGNIGAKIQIKEKKGRIELKLSCRWSTLDDYPQKDRDKIHDWHESMKSVKRRMGSSFKEVTKAAANGIFPPNKAIEDFVETSQVFAASAEPEWHDAMNEYMDHLENFVRAVNERQFEVMLHEVRDLQNRMKACHREFK